MKHTPATIQLYTELSTAYQYFNKHLVESQLPDCLITLERNMNRCCYFSQAKWTDKEEKEVLDEIAVNPTLFKKHSLDYILSSLVVEMAHLWQCHFRKPPKRRYMNKELSKELEDIGIMTSENGEPGGKRTGAMVDHYIIAGGKFKKVCKQLISGGFIISWQNIEEKEEEVEVPGKKKNKSNRQKYQCPKCDLKAWAKPEAPLICGECNLEME